MWALIHSDWYPCKRKSGHTQETPGTGAAEREASEGTARRQPSANQESPLKKPNLSRPRFGLLASGIMRNRFLSFKQVCSILLWQP